MLFNFIFGRIRVIKSVMRKALI